MVFFVWWADKNYSYTDALYRMSERVLPVALWYNPLVPKLEGHVEFDIQRIQSKDKRIVTGLVTHLIKKNKYKTGKIDLFRISYNLIPFLALMCATTFPTMRRRILNTLIGVGVLFLTHVMEIFLGLQRLITTIARDNLGQFAGNSFWDVILPGLAVFFAKLWTQIGNMAIILVLWLLLANRNIPIIDDMVRKAETEESSEENDVGAIES